MEISNENDSCAYIESRNVFHTAKLPSKLSKILKLLKQPDRGSTVSARILFGA